MGGGSLLLSLWFGSVAGKEEEAEEEDGDEDDSRSIPSDR